MNPEIRKKIDHPIAEMAYQLLETDKVGISHLSEESIHKLVKALLAYKSVAERERAANVLMTLAGHLIVDKNGSEAASALMDISQRALWTGSMKQTEEEKLSTVKAATKAQLYSLAKTAPHVDAKPPTDTVTLRSLAIPPRRMRG